MNVLQREEMRAKFPGVPGDLVNYFVYVAEEVSFYWHFYFKATIHPHDTSCIGVLIVEPLIYRISLISYKSSGCESWS
jgi:hypothetical protein